jgi:tetratricopeptide (TPR) repeat protein
MCASTPWTPASPCNSWWTWATSRIWARTANRSPRPPIKELRYNLARDLADSGKLAEAEAIHAELWQAHPDESRFGLHLFNAQLRRADTAAARETLALLEQRKRDYAERARAELPRLKEAWKDRQPEDFSEQEQRQLRKLRKQAGTNQATFAWLKGRLLAAEGRPGEALVAFEQAEQVQMHNRPSLFQAQGEALLAIRRFADAEARFRRVLEIDPVNADASLGLARALLMQRGQAEGGAGGGLRCPRAGLLSTPRSLSARGGADAARPAGAGAGRLRDRGGPEPGLSGGPSAAGATRLALGRSGPRRSISWAWPRRRCAGFGRCARAPRGRASARRRRWSLRPSPAWTSSADPRRCRPLADDEIVIVSGLPRSGTSMLMQMLAAGGVPILTDGKRAADEDNPRGYLEYAAAKRPDAGSGWLLDARGKAVKIVAQLLPALTAKHRYRVIFAERPLHEILASQRVMLERSGKPGGRLAERRMAGIFLKQMAQVQRILTPHGERVQVLSVPYHEALADPSAAAERLNDFLGGGLDLAAMAAAVAPSLRRQGAAARE